MPSTIRMYLGLIALLVLLLQACAEPASHRTKRLAVDKSYIGNAEDPEFQWGPRNWPIPGDYVLRVCEVSYVRAKLGRPQEVHDYSWCRGFFSALEALWFRDQMYCPLPGTSPNEVRDAAVAFLRANRERLNEPAMSLVLEGLHTKWPCQ